LPAFLSSRAAVSPARPAPTTITSADAVGIFLAAFFLTAAPAPGVPAAAPAAAAAALAPSIWRRFMPFLPLTAVTLPTAA
jgi:hypothetical protein